MTRSDTARLQHYMNLTKLYQTEVGRLSYWEMRRSFKCVQLSFIIFYPHSYQLWKFDTDYKLQQLFELQVSLEDGEEFRDCCFGGQNDEYALAISSKLHTNNLFSI